MASLFKYLNPKLEGRREKRRKKSSWLWYCINPLFLNVYKGVAWTCVFSKWLLGVTADFFSLQATCCLSLWDKNVVFKVVRLALLLNLIWKWFYLWIILFRLWFHNKGLAGLYFLLSSGRRVVYYAFTSCGSFAILLLEDCWIDLEIGTYLRNRTQEVVK